MLVACSLCGMIIVPSELSAGNRVRISPPGGMQTMSTNSTLSLTVNVGPATKVWFLVPFDQLEKVVFTPFVFLIDLTRAPFLDIVRRRLFAFATGSRTGKVSQHNFERVGVWRVILC